MTTPSPAHIERKVRQLDNDVQSIYEMLNGIAGTQARHGNRLDELDGRLGEIAGTQARHGNRLGEVHAKLGEVHAKLDTVDTKLDTVITMIGEGR